MSELAGTAAVAIDGVEWSAAGAGRLTVTVTGRWRRRRPGAAGQPVLLLEVGGRRQRYPAMPEPPSLAGTGPGVWRLRFSLPGEVAPELGRMWLALGGAMIPLPAAEAVPGPGQPAASPAQARTAPEDRQPERASEAASGLGAVAVSSEGTWRSAAPPPVAGRDRLRLARELRLARRGDATGNDVVPGTGLEAGGIQLEKALRAELDVRAREEAELRARLAATEGRLAARIVIERRTAAVVAELRRELETLRRALDREREMRAAAQARTQELEQALDAQWTRSRGASSAIAGLREELRQLAELAASPIGRPAPPRRPPAPAAPPIPAAPPPQMPDGPGPVTGAPGSSLIEPARLTEARERLRGAIAGPEVSLPAGTEAARDQRRSLERAFRRLASRDAAAAGRLLLALLPLQASVWPGPIAYDLVLAGDRCLEVTSRDGRTAVRVRRQPRPPAAAELSLTGDPGRVARLVVAGRLRRLMGWGVARIRGRRKAISALEALLRAPLDPVALHRAGVRLDAATALALVSAAVEPSWTRGERFVLACGEPGGPLAVMEVRRGRAAIVPRAKQGARVTTTIRCRAAELLLALSGVHVSSLTVDGDERPLALVREWLERASSG